MSNVFRIKLGAELINLHDNEILLPITLAEILPRAEMESILTRQLLEDGWQQSEENGAFTLGPEERTANATLTIDADLKQLRIDSLLISDRTVALYEEEIPADQLARIKAGEPVTLEDIGISSADNEQAQIAEGKLNNLIINSRRQINQSLAQVYRQAVLEKAGSLGTVESVQEHQNENGTRISIRVKG